MPRQTVPTKMIRNIVSKSNHHPFLLHISVTPCAVGLTNILSLSYVVKDQ